MVAPDDSEIKDENQEEKNDEMTRFSLDDEGNVTFSSDESERSLCTTSCCKTVHRVRTDAVLQEKVLYTICLFIPKFMVGWGKGLFGPSFIDIRMISGTDLEQGSWMITTLFIGYALGSLVQGAIYDRTNRKLWFSAVMFTWCAAMATIPWCAIFEAMLAAYLVVGLMQGMLGPGTSAEVIRLWGKDGGVVFQGAQVAFAIGSAIAPLVATPFITDPHIRHSFNGSSESSAMDNYTSRYSNVSMDTKRLDNRSFELGFNITSQNSESNLYIPFSITAGIGLISVIYFIWMYFMYDKHPSHTQKHTDTSKVTREAPKKIKIIFFFMIGAMLFFSVAMDEVFSNYLATYCVEYFHWSKKSAALITSVFFVLVVISRVVSIVGDKWFDTLVYTGVNLTLVLLSVLGLMLISVYNLYSAAWFFTPLFGFARSSIFALLFSWTNEYITRVTGRISSFYYVTGMMGSALNPILLGYLMENYGLIWFCYLNLIESIIILVVYVFAAFLTKYNVRHYGYTFKEQTVEVKLKSSDDTAI